MRKRTSGVIVLVVLMLAVGAFAVVNMLAARAPLTVTIADPTDNLTVEYGLAFEVSGAVLSGGDAGSVNSYVQYAIGEGGTAFRDVNGTDLQIESGTQPQTQTLLNGQSYSVGWTLKGNPGTYEIRIYSEGATSETAWSESRTVTIQPGQPPPGASVVSRELQDSSTGFGKATGDYSNTFLKDGICEVLSEERNTHATTTPIDDTTELGWIYAFENLPARNDTDLYLYARASFEELSPVPDSDRAFLAQQNASGTWHTILMMTNTSDQSYRADIPDDASGTVFIRIVDNDRLAGNYHISSVQVDQAYVMCSSEVPPPSSGQEILTGFTPPGSSYHVAVYENRDGGWYNDYNIDVQSKWHVEIEVADLDGDGGAEIVIAEGGLIQVFRNQSGTLAPIYNLQHPGGGAVHSIEVCDIDNDGSIDSEIVSCAGETVNIWKKVDASYAVCWNQTFSGSCMSVAAGNLDSDDDNEFVVGVFGGVDEFPIVYLFDNRLGTWQIMDSYQAFLTLGNEFDKVEINDVDNDATNEVIALAWHEPLQVLELTAGRLVNAWTAPWAGYSHGFITGDVTNDGLVDMVLSEYYHYKFLAVFECRSGVFTNTFNISVGDLGLDGSYNMDIGDIDNDGLNEFVYGEQLSSPANKLRIFRNDTQIYAQDVEYDCLSVEIGDYDNDMISPPTPQVQIDPPASNSDGRLHRRDAVFHAEADRRIANSTAVVSALAEEIRGSDVNKVALRRHST